MTDSNDNETAALSGVASSDMLSGLERALRADPEFGPKFAEMDEIDKAVADCIDCVDLDIAFTPVILGAGTSTRDAVEIDYKGENGKYVISSPFKMLTEDEVRKARARFLVVRGREMKPAMDRFFA